MNEDYNIENEDYNFNSIDEKKVFNQYSLLKLTLYLFIASVGCIFFYFIRFKLSRRDYTGFFVWNLIYAWIPYIIALIIAAVVNNSKRRIFAKIVLVILGIIWLVFYPNSPYLFTDFIHIIERASPAPIIRKFIIISTRSLVWYDIILSSSFAFIGHFIGLISIFIVHKSYSKVFIHHFGWIHICIAMFFGGFGVYIGRIIRFNSWEVFIKPLVILKEILLEFMHLRALVFSFVFGFFIFISYIALYSFQNILNNEEN